MARIRSLKPEFFTDEDIAKLPPLYRLAFEGLWCQADKAGRLEDRPERLKVQILPYDDVSFGVVLDALVTARFVQRYSGSDGRAYLQVRSFEKHQRPRPDEPDSVLPSPQQVRETDTNPALHSDATVSPQSIGKERKGKEGERNTSRVSPASSLVDLWNSLVTPPIPKVTKLTSDRRAKLDARLKAFPDLEQWRAVIAWINAQDWCRAPGTGAHPNWTATLDWLCKSDGQVQRYLEKIETPAARERQPWICPHVKRCDHREMCENNSILGRPRKAEAS